MKKRMHRAMLVVAFGTIACSSDHMGTGPVASRLVFTVQPSAATAGVVLSPGVQVTALDDAGAVVTSFGGTITIALATNPGAATLSGTLTTGAVAGVATFSDLRLNRTGSGYAFRASSGALTAATSGTFAISPAPPQQLAYFVQPTDAVAGAAIVPAVQVQARDSLGNLTPGFTGAVSLVLTTNAGGAVLAGTTTVSAVAGAATFSALHVDKSGSGFAMLATATSLTQATSNTFTVSPAAPARLKFTAQPSAATAGVAIAPAVQVTALDAYGNTATGFGGSVSLSIGVNPGGGTLSGTIPVTASSGIASFADLSLSKAGSGYTLVASAAGLASDTSTAFTIGAASVSAGQSTVGAAPGSIGACNASCSSGGGTASLVTVTARDQFGNSIAGASVTVAVSGSGNAFSPSSLTQTASNTGQATWTLNSTTAETKTISATIAGVAITQTATVTVAASAASAGQSTVTAAPGSITACNAGCSTGGGTASLITVTAKDQFGNAIPNAAVTLGATGLGNTITQPGATGPTGVTTGVISSTVAGMKTVTGTVNGLPITQSPVVTVVAGPVSAGQSTVHATQDTIEASSGGVTTSIAVMARDALGNAISGASVTVSATGTGVTLASPTGVTDGTGAYSQATLSATTIGAKIVSATIGGVVVTQTDTVTVVAGEVSTSQSTIAASPATITATSGSGGATITVTARDDQGNPIPGINVVLAATGAGNTLIQPSGGTNASGVATGTLRSTKAEPKIISATIGGTGLPQTDTVTVTPAAASTVAFTVQPTSATIATAIAPPIQVQVRDQFGNPVTTSTAKVALAIGANPGGGTLTGGDSVLPSNGIATFAGVSINALGTNYTLVAGAGGVAGQATSDPFNIIAGAVSAATSLVSATPGAITASTGSSTSTITVTARDAGSNPVSGATVSLTVTGSGNTLTPAGLLTTNPSGVATATLSATAAGVKTISAVINGVAVTQQTSVTVAAAAISGSQSTLLASPGAIVQGTGVSTITVTATDVFGNPVSGASVSLAATGSGNSLTQPSAPTDANGIATGTLSSSAAENKIVTAIVNSVALTHSDTVVVTAQGSSVVLVGAGDIAVCGKADDDSTAALVTGVLNATPGAEVITLGDNAYPDGTTSDFNNCYDSTWGAFKAQTHPSAGNHDYNTAGAAPYFAYFGAAAGDPAQGYYSYDIGAWHVIVLNSEIATSAGSPQVQWLQADLAAHPNVCTLAYWHEPLYSSVGGTAGTTGATISSVQPFWDALYAAGADLVLNGHRHVYERLARMAPDGSPDPTNGIREIIVGTGGDSGGDLTNIFPTSEVRNGRTYGVIKLTLLQSSYSWQFLPAEGATFTDSGTESCH